MTFSVFRCEQSPHTGIAMMAGRELASFVAAVTESFGAAQAELAAEDWLDEVEGIDCRQGGPVSCWRQVTIAAASRLASRIAALRPERIAIADCPDIPIASELCLGHAMHGEG
jgi:hypothetical protein